MAPGLLPFVLWPISHRDPISPTLRAIIVALVVGLGLLIFLNFRRIARQGRHDDRLPAVVGYAGSVLLTLLIFPAQAELGLTVLGVLALGDGSATLGGMLLGGPTLPWNPRKTWSGSLCFVLVGGLLASVIYWGETHNLEAQTPGVSFATALACGIPAALAGAIVESLPLRINDNIRVGVAAAVTVAVAHGIVVGWS
jgi:phytol kinase